MNGKEIRAKREELGLTQEDLAKKLGISPRTIQNYEAGGKIPTTRHELLRAFLYKNRPMPEINVSAQVNESNNTNQRTPLDKERALIDSIHKMTETAENNSRTAERNSITLEKLVDLLVANNVPLNEIRKKGSQSDKEDNGGSANAG